MERAPRESIRKETLLESKLRYPETFGLEPISYERELPKVIRDLSNALHRFEREGGDEEIREMFAGVYSQKTIEADLQDVHRLERVFNLEDSHRERIGRVYSLTLEYIVADVSHVWFPDCSIWRSYKFDDYKRQVDLFMDVPGLDGEPVTLGLDVSSGHRNASEKLLHAMAEYRLGQFHDVKYFASDTDPDRKRGFFLLPRMVVGASQFGIASLARAYGNYLHAPENEKETELQRLRFHPFGGELYTELLQELELAYTLIRRKAKATPGSQFAPSHVLSGRLKKIQAARKALTQRYRQWEKERKAYLKQDREFAASAEPPDNDVLEAVLEAS